MLARAAHLALWYPDTLAESLARLAHRKALAADPAAVSTADRTSHNRLVNQAFGVVSTMRKPASKCRNAVDVFARRASYRAKLRMETRKQERIAGSNDVPPQVTRYRLAGLCTLLIVEGH